MVIGLNHQTAPLATRERFWIGENRRYEVLRKLKSAEVVEEVLVLSTRCRTEFMVWASEPTLAANSLLQYLASEHGLKLRMEGEGKNRREERLRLRGFQRAFTVTNSGAEDFQRVRIRLRYW
jgi:glutamyl-tRNA reductase